jgi:ATP:cob(I)alamin adenosyltransferase
MKKSDKKIKSIVTKTGDNCKTSLLGGKRVHKDNIRIELGGQLDELSSFLGLIKSMVKQKETKVFIESIQKDIFVMGSEVANPGKSKTNKKITSDNIKKIEILIDKLQIVKAQTCFVVTGLNPLSSVIDITRSIARRVERCATGAKRKKILTNKSIFIYLNRLSDVLFLLARHFE